MRVCLVVFSILVVISSVGIATAGEPPVPIEGKLLVSQGSGVYYMEGTSDNVIPYAISGGDADISSLGDQVVYDLVGWEPTIHLPPGDVWTSPLVPMNPVNVTLPLGLGGISCQPLWSPDASQIAFRRSDPLPGQYPCWAGWTLWVMDANGSNAHEVLPGTACTTALSWAPNGYRLLACAGGVSITVDTDGTDLQTVPNAGDWSPDGSKVATSWTVEDTVDGEHGNWRQLVVANIDGTNTQVVWARFHSDADLNAHLALYPDAGIPDPFGSLLYWVGPCDAVWSPVGDRIAFTAADPFDPQGCCFYGQDRVWIYELSTGDLTQLPGDGGNIWSLSWHGNNTLPTNPEVTVDNTTITFAEVSSPGVTTIIRDDDPPALPTGYDFCGSYYEANTTATFTGPIVLQMSYTHDEIPGGIANEPSLALLHYNETSGLWENVTTSLDMDNNVVYGQVNSLSPIGLAVMPTFAGFFQPINNDNSSVFKRGSTIPVKFSLANASGSRLAEATAHLWTRQVSSAILGMVAEASTAAWADAGNVFRYDATAGQYIYNLSTKALSTGTYELKVTVEGWPGFEKAVLVGLR